MNETARKDIVDEAILRLRREIVAVRQNRPGPRELVDTCDRLDAAVDTLETALTVPVSTPVEEEQADHE